MKYVLDMIGLLRTMKDKKRDSPTDSVTVKETSREPFTSKNI